MTAVAITFWLMLLIAASYGTYWGGQKWNRTRHEKWFLFIMACLFLLLLFGRFLNLAVREVL